MARSSSGLTLEGRLVMGMAMLFMGAVVAMVTPIQPRTITEAGGGSYSYEAKTYKVLESPIIVDGHRQAKVPRSRSDTLTQAQTRTCDASHSAQWDARAGGRLGVVQAFDIGHHDHGAVVEWETIQTVLHRVLEFAGLSGLWARTRYPHADAAPPPRPRRPYQAPAEWMDAASCGAAHVGRVGNSAHEPGFE